jgi:hypothetical protein
MSIRLYALIVAALACAAGPASGQLVLNRFDTAAEVARWRNDFGIPSTLSFDAAKDAAGSASSGALKVETTFSTTAGGDNKTAITTDAFATPTDVSGYAALEADFFIAPGSAESFNPGSGIFGYHQFAIRNTNNYNYQAEGGRNFGPAGQWFHVSVPVSGFAQPVDAMRALTMQIYGGPGHNLQGPVTFWVDNVAFTPEPAALGLLAPALAVLLRRRRGA